MAAARRTSRLTMQAGATLSNVTENVMQRVRMPAGDKLHVRPHHPLCTLRRLIEEYFEQSIGRESGGLQLFTDMPAVVSTTACFDELLVARDHPSRRPTDTYYVDESTVLRAHTTAHDTELLRRGLRCFLVSGDVYRRDAIDRKHYPVFHQVDGVRVFENAPSEDWVLDDLKRTLFGLAQHLFRYPVQDTAAAATDGTATDGEEVPVRWVDAEFPFTRRSLELEVLWQGEWLEVLGCGVLQPDVLRAGNVDPERASGWAFGLGLERLAMVLFGIPDIRLFWSSDRRFTSQFRDGAITRFRPFSKYPPVYKDISMWVKDAPADADSNGTAAAGFHENDLCELVRSVAGDLVEDITCTDSFVHPKTKRRSNCYRITFRSTERSLTDEEINDMQFRIRDQIAHSMSKVAELR